jgi:hypothetical protein
VGGRAVCAAVPRAPESARPPQTFWPPTSWTSSSARARVGVSRWRGADGAIDPIRRFVARPRVWGTRARARGSDRRDRGRRSPASPVQSHAADITRPGLTGAVLQREDVAAEIVCDGHRAPGRRADRDRRKSPSRVMASPTAPPDRVSRRFRTRSAAAPSVRDTARLDDGTMAGSVLTWTARLHFSSDRSA